MINETVLWWVQFFNIKKSLILIATVTSMSLSSCKKTDIKGDESFGKIYSNLLPLNGVKSNYSHEEGFINLEKMESALNENDRLVFLRSVSWYATESEFDFERINNKTAREIVEVVNCLKSSRGKHHSLKLRCFY